MKMAVHLHLYYHEQLGSILDKLKNISGCNWDLFVTVCKENEESKNKILAFKPDAKIILVENRGYDVGPFIEFLHRIDLNKYDLVMKLHTKNKYVGADTYINRYIFNRKLWVEMLMQALIGSPQIFQKNIKELAMHPEIGMIGSKYLITSDPECSKNVQQQVNKILDELDYHSVPIKFVAGTMFMCRSKLLKPFIDNYTIMSFAPTDGSIKDGTLSHALERVFGSTVIANGYKIKGFDHNYIMQLKSSYAKVCRFIYQNKVTTHQKRLIKVFKLPVYHRRIL